MKIDRKLQKDALGYLARNFVPQDSGHTFEDFVQEQVDHYDGDAKYKVYVSLLKDWLKQ